MGIRPALVPEINCQNVLTSLRFYTDILGFHVRYERPEKGFYFLERQGAEIMIEQLDGTSWLTAEAVPPLGRGMNLQIATTNLTALYETCKAKGALIFRDWEEAWYRADDTYVGQVQFIVQDPDGYLLRFEQGLGLSKSPGTGRVVG